jgi:hypothetical protein
LSKDRKINASQVFLIIITINRKEVNSFFHFCITKNGKDEQGKGSQDEQLLGNGNGR